MSCILGSSGSTHDCCRLFKVLLNLNRGECDVDELELDALEAALESGRMTGRGLDALSFSWLSCLFTLINKLLSFSINTIASMVCFYS